MIVLSILLFFSQRITLMKTQVFSEVESLMEENSNINSNDMENDNSIEAVITAESDYIEDNGNDALSKVSEEDIKASKDSASKKKYIGYLIIPRISLNYGFVSKNSSYNNVNRNIKVLPVSDFPDTENGNLIIAGHSGNSEISYFKNLYKLSVGDKAQVKYKERVYTYKIVTIYKVLKDGAISIKRDVNKSCLTLITCTYNDNHHQTVYIAELENIEGV